MPRTISELFMDLSSTQELVLRILSFLEREEDQSHVPLAFRSDNSPKFFPRYATISRDWQYAVERETFSSFTVKSSELDLFSRTFAPAHRRAALGTLTYETVLPRYDDEASGRFENAGDKEANDLAFSEAIHGLFAVLKSWEESLLQTQPQTQPRPLKLSFHSVYSPSDISRRGAEVCDLKRQEFELGKRKFLREHRYEHSVIRLQRWGELPTLSRVNDFRAMVHWDRVVEPRSIVRVASKFPSLEVIEWVLSDDEKKDAKLRQQLRSDFARSLDFIPQSKLKSFTLEYYNNAPLNHHFIQSNAQRSASELDELSVALNKLSQSPNLGCIFLTGPIAISPDLYQPPPPPTPTSAWQKLEEFHLTFNICTPSGEWYFERDPNAASNDDDESEKDDVDDGNSEPDSDSTSTSGEDSSPNSNPSISTNHSYHPRTHDRQTGMYPISTFRRYPATGKILALLQAFATATAHMPALRRAGLKAGLPPHLAQFEVLFLRRGEVHSLDSEVDEGLGIELVRRRPRLYFQTGRWRADEDGEAFDRMLDVFRRLQVVHATARKAHGEADELLIKFFEW
ncbi:MAG: hypothetical protein M1818_003501 [Claussenomyces sp. TS43310]|nr:MAG: hypothetical protein M1818_003501 [Claussenomyces sp. TS43310]